MALPAYLKNGLESEWGDTGAFVRRLQAIRADLDQPEQHETTNYVDLYTQLGAVSLAAEDSGDYRATEASMLAALHREIPQRGPGSAFALGVATAWNREIGRVQRSLRTWQEWLSQPVHPDEVIRVTSDFQLNHLILTRMTELYAASCGFRAAGDGTAFRSEQEELERLIRSLRGILERWAQWRVGAPVADELLGKFSSDRPLWWEFLGEAVMSEDE